MKRSEYYKVVSDVRKESFKSYGNEIINWDLLADRLGFPPLEEELRRTGRSTALAFHYIGLALGNLGSDVAIKDHYDSREADKHLMRIIEDILIKTNLKGWTISWTDLTLRFDLEKFKK